MKKLLFTLSAITLCTTAIFAQKGVDNQNRRIQQEATRTVPTNTDASAQGRGFDFGKDKTKVRELLANPYKLASRRDQLVAAIYDILKEQKLTVDTAASRPNDGIIVTQPMVFAKGTVITQAELNRYAVLPSSSATAWRGGRYSLRIEVSSIDGIQNNVAVTAKVDGKSESGLITEWTSLQSSGVAEDEFLVKLVESVTGQTIDAPKPDTDN